MVWTKIQPSSVTLTLGLPERIFQIAHLLIMEKILSNCFEIHCIIIVYIEVMVQTNLDRRTHASMNSHTHTPNCHYDNYVSHTTSGLDKNGQ